MIPILTTFLLILSFTYLCELRGWKIAQQNEDGTQSSSLTGFKEERVHCSFVFFFIYQILIDPDCMASERLGRRDGQDGHCSCLSRGCISMEH